MYYRINEEATGGYQTADGKRVALLSNPKPAQQHLRLYTPYSTEQEAAKHFRLQPFPETEAEQI